MKAKGILLMLSVAMYGLLFWPDLVQGKLITIEVEGVVDDVRDQAGHLEGKVEVGDIIIGWYTYDTSTPDSAPSPSGALYEHYNSPAGISLSIGDFNFRTNPDNVDFAIGILNDYPPSMKDQFWLTSYNNLPLPNEAIVDIISWQLDDPTGTALSSTDLLPGPPILDNWESVFGLGIQIGKSHIRGHITSAIPEPVTMIFLTLGGLFLRKRKYSQI